MNIKFSKYHGTGNDFVLIDNRDFFYSQLKSNQIKKICDRRFGVGADGLMLIENFKGFDFKMVYFNSDGNVSSMCGNGGRCIVSFAKKLSVVKQKAIFLAVDGIHQAKIKSKNTVELEMNSVSKIEILNNAFVLNTGSPHYVKFVKNLSSFDVEKEGRKIRNNSRFKAFGINVNFIELIDSILHVRTYERGVESETLSCGTGVVAASLVASMVNSDISQTVNVQTLGGKLSVSFSKTTTTFEKIFLTGDAVHVFDGELIL